MPIKWKIYYACSLYTLICYLGLFGIVVYFFIDSHNSLTDILEAALTFVVLALGIYKSVLSIKFVGHLSQKSMFNKAERVFYIAGYCLNVLLLILVVLGIFLIIYNILKSPYPYRSDLSRSFTFIALSILFFTLLVNIIFDFPLSKAIRRQGTDDIATIGSHIYDNV